MTHTTTRRIAVAVFALSFLLILPLAGCKKTAPPDGDVSLHQQIQDELDDREWRDYRNADKKLDRETLEKSLELATDFMIANQKEAGNFYYMYDWKKGEQMRGDNQVRQAGALWGTALLHQYKPEARTKKALEKGLDFFFEHSVAGPNGSLVVKYPGDSTTSTGTVALVALAITEYLRTDDVIGEKRRAELEDNLSRYVKFLVAMQMDNGHFARGFRTRSGSRVERTSPYFDGETLLALCKAAKYAGHDELVPVIEKAADALAKTYVFAYKRDGKHDRTKGFYQWGTMSFWEYQDAGWKNSDLYRDAALMLAHWMIVDHRTLRRTRNTAYAHEGLIHAYLIAKAKGDEIAASHIARTTDRALYKLMTWQVAGPLSGENGYLADQPKDDAFAAGGFQNHRREAPLRIDVTQHQSHAMILALKYLYPASEGQSDK